VLHLLRAGLPPCFSSILLVVLTNLSHAPFSNLLVEDDPESRQFMTVDMSEKYRKLFDKDPEEEYEDDDEEEDFAGQDYKWRE
jgi:hypothetical protein